MIKINKFFLLDIAHVFKDNLPVRNPTAALTVQNFATLT